VKQLQGKTTEQEFIPAPNKLSLDELYDAAQELGKVEIGSFSQNKAELKVNFTKDYIDLKCEKYPDVRQNLAEVIERARKLKQFYHNEGWI